MHKKLSALKKKKTENKAGDGRQETGDAKTVYSRDPELPELPELRTQE